MTKKEIFAKNLEKYRREGGALPIIYTLSRSAEWWSWRRMSGHRVEDLILQEVKKDPDAFRGKGEGIAQKIAVERIGKRLWEKSKTEILSIIFGPKDKLILEWPKDEDGIGLSVQECKDLFPVKVFDLLMIAHFGMEEWEEFWDGELRGNTFKEIDGNANKAF